ncbi:MAG TPA: Ger(x)C family spore germination protein [Syntrophomonadaceae bacterium]|jgi:Ger(x)C family germination protein|nr:Ger(x)C family spore germination protein [Syntrophomonadaceae bacterium]
MYPKNNRKRFMALLLLSSLFLTSGCWNQVEVINTIEAVGLFLGQEDGQLLVGVQLAEPSSSQSGTQPRKPLNAFSTGATYSDAARRVMLNTPRLPIWPHASVMLIGGEVAHGDLALVADFLARNRNIRKTSLLFIGQGASAKEFLEAELPIEPYPIAGLRKLINIQEKQVGVYKPITVDEFLKSLAEPGIQPAVPQVVIQEADGKQVLALQGTSIFKERRQVGTFDEIESQGYRFLSAEMITGGLLSFPPPGESSSDGRKYITVELTRSLAKTKVETEGNKVKKVVIEVDAEGNFYDQNFAEQILNLENIARIEQATNNEMQGRMTAAIIKAQGLESDVFGWGLMLHQQDPQLWRQVEHDWPRLFSGLETEVKVNFAIRRSYLLDHSFEFIE